jgi:hypothetical protein
MVLGASDHHRLMITGRPGGKYMLSDSGNMPGMAMGLWSAHDSRSATDNTCSPDSAGNHVLTKLSNSFIFFTFAASEGVIPTDLLRDASA